MWKTSSGHYALIMGKGDRMANGRKMWEDIKYVGCALGSDGSGGLAHCWFANKN